MCRAIFKALAGVMMAPNNLWEQCNLGQDQIRFVQQSGGAFLSCSAGELTVAIRRLGVGTGGTVQSVGNRSKAERQHMK